MQLYKMKDPFILTIFGASGDLAKLKLFPALYALMEQRRFPENFYIVGYARTKKSQQEFRQDFCDAILASRPESEINKAFLEKLLSKVFYFHGKYDNIQDFKKYRTYLKKIVKEKGNLLHIAYFSVPPQMFKPIIQNLGETKSRKDEDLRVVIEKPFGEDLASANDLFHFLARYFDEEHTYLLDHYLGKAAVQSILHLRHSNRVLNHMMKGSEIANIQITAFEDAGVTNRIGYFDQVGILKDMIQSHLLQVLALITMSIPITENATSLHREKYSILSALSITKASHNVVLGQYKSYKKEPGVPKSSKADTFAALRLFIDRESWYKVPIYIRAGKKLHEKHTYVTIEFKKFEFQKPDEAPNLLIIELHPDEKISIKLLTRNNFGGLNYRAITTSESLACAGDDCLPEHGLLLLDVVRKNKESFLSFPEIIAGWTLAEKVFHSIKSHKTPVEIYADDTDGPANQTQLTSMDGFTWHDVH